MEAMEDFLKTVGSLYDETRVKLLKFIELNGAVCVCELQESFEMIQSRLSRHLKILKDAGFLRLKRDGRLSYYEMRSPLDRFRSEVLEEIKALPIDIPKLKRKECKL
jgi:ArsR family transcriptional regulator